VAFNIPFAPLPANTIGFTAGTSAQSRQVTLANFWGNSVGVPNYWPPQLRINNLGSVPIWIWFSSAVFSIVIPTPGTNTVGTPQQAIPIVPGIIEIFTLSNFMGANLWISDISTANSQNYWLTPGEGL
jgi:hypothetical protein